MQERFSSVPFTACWPPDHKLALDGCFGVWVNKDCPTQIECFSFLALLLQCPEVMIIRDVSDREDGVWNSNVCVAGGDVTLSYIYLTTYIY